MHDAQGAASEPGGEPPARRRNPWWIPPFLGRVPDAISPPLVRLLGLVSLGLAFENYDLALINAVIKHVAEDLGMSVDDIGFYTAVARAGGFLTFGLVAFADRLGRRRVFLGALIGMSVFTVATAFAQSPWQFGAAQFVTRAFMLTAAATGIVILTEETPAAHRGWSVGMLGALGAFGYGLGMLAFAFIDVLPFGWRALYMWGAAPLFLLPFFRREIAETARFEKWRGASLPPRVSLRGWVEPMLRLAYTHPRRAAAVGGAGLFYSLGSIAVFQFNALYVQEVHGWRPWHISVMVIGAGLLGILGNPLAGRLSDRIGRRRVGFGAFALYPLAAGLFYNAPGWVLPLAWVFIVLFGTAGEVIVRVVATELFPTSHRGTAAGWLTLVQTAGWTAGLVVMWLTASEIAHVGPRVSAIAAAVALGGLCLLAVPETSRRELETIAGEAGGDGEGEVPAAAP